MNLEVLKKQFITNEKDALLMDVYLDEALLPYLRERFAGAIDSFIKAYKVTDGDIYSAPGRTEVGGNHTDHQHGRVLAASINRDAIAVVSKADSINVISEAGGGMITIDINDLEKKDGEEGTTASLIRGVAAGLKNRGYKIGGFNAYVTSDVLIGAGLSSSAAFETLIGTIISGMYNDMQVSAIEIAQIGQFAENVYFGKPCGLMDQMASSVGSLVTIDFKDPEAPVVEKVEFDMASHGYSLCITDTKADHVNLTPDYAAVPAEMKAAAAVFGKEYLREVDPAELFANISLIREKVNDRAALRALHFITENARVGQQVDALRAGDINAFLAAVKASGDSSYKYLQNVYTNKDVEHQAVSIALGVSDYVLNNGGASHGVARVHGGGFAGTIAAFVQNDFVPEYKKTMDKTFGEGACSILQIRKYGGMKLI
ncbi:MAG TPA: galactokinase [Lachnospiraceae bacterium]|nr:galactokinase [Lachnospiraceae bacterium]